jgi:predicted RNA-binding protein with PUA-like domain
VSPRGPGETKPRARAAPRYWLLKSEPDVFSFEDLWRAQGRRTLWDGVRNYQARNLLRDELARGDGVLFYHSNAEPPGVAGVARVVRAGYPDPTQLDPDDAHHDPESTPEAPRWYAVDVQAVRALPRFVSLAELRAEPRLGGMELLRWGSRLSVQPVTPAHWRVVLELGGLDPALEL